MDFSQCQVFPSHLRVVSFYSYTLKSSPFCIFVLVHKRIFFHLVGGLFVSCNIILDRLSLKLWGCASFTFSRRLIAVIRVHSPHCPSDRLFFLPGGNPCNFCCNSLGPFAYHGSLFQGLFVKYTHLRLILSHMAGCHTLDFSEPTFFLKSVHSNTSVLILNEQGMPHQIIKSGDYLPQKTTCLISKALPSNN